MDGFAFHPYEDNSSVAPVSGMHPNTTTIALADYDKLVALLGRGVRRLHAADLVRRVRRRDADPGCEAEPLHRTRSRRRRSRSTEATQAAYYRQAVQLAFCQPNVRGLFLFHAIDESDLTGWQSGLYYADDTPKTSLAPVRLALEQSRRGVDRALRRPCSSPCTRRSCSAARSSTLTCDLDCSYVGQLYRLPGPAARLEARPSPSEAKPTTLPLRVPAKTRARTGCGSLRSRAVNPGRAATLRITVRHG